MSSYEFDNEITLLYSSPEVISNFENMQTVAQEDLSSGLSSDRPRDTLLGDNTTIGRRLNLGYDLESNEFSKEELELQQRKENNRFFSPTPGDDQGMKTFTSEKNKHPCTLMTNNATLSFKQGEFIAIIGKRESGKMALLRLLSGRLICGCKQVRCFRFRNN